jgi:hypothetical protein
MRRTRLPASIPPCRVIARAGPVQSFCSRRDAMPNMFTKHGARRTIGSVPQFALNFSCSGRPRTPAATFALIHQQRANRNYGSSNLTNNSPPGASHLSATACPCRLAPEGGASVHDRGRIGPRVDAPDQLNPEPKLPPSPRCADSSLSCTPAFSRPDSRIGAKHKG